MMTIFIKTYKNDLKWLKYCLMSIAKYAQDFKVVIVADEDCKRDLDGWNLTREKVFYVKPSYEGYLYQQEVKLTAFMYVDTEYVLFMDCDCIFTDYVNLDSFLKDGKPTLLKTPYEDIPEVMFWKTTTEDAIGFEVNFEYMRRNGLCYRTETIMNLWDDFSIRFLPKLKIARNRQFSEFNLIGAYIEKYEENLYNIVNTRDEIPYHPVKQFWSYSGLNKNDLKEIQVYL
jgi:hypothetical protein